MQNMEAFEEKSTASEIYEEYLVQRENIYKLKFLL